MAAMKSTTVAMKSTTVAIVSVLVFSLVVLNPQGIAARSAVCSLPRKTGPCRARMPRFYYDSRKGGCVQFVYGGCRGNANNFETRAKCLRACGAQ